MPTRKYQLGAGDLILNSPFEEPAGYWSYDRQHRVFTQMEGRRPAGYVIATPDAQGFDDPGQFIELDLVNQIRPYVKAWREANYPGVTGITRRLLEHWNDPDQREGKRFFFCQLEAIETLIWLTEAAGDDRQGIEIPGDGGPFPRWCSKMATGSGKTIVMSMVIAWQVLNKATYPDDPRFCRHFLAIAPGLTVRNRLQVLKPDEPGNYFDEFQIVPTSLFDKLRQGQVIVQHWHKLEWESDKQLSRRRSVDKRGAKSDEAYIREVLGEMARAERIIVLNDEAHHAWRVNPEMKVKGVAKADVEEATKWVGGLDRIHRARGVMQCFDFSATPFAPSGGRSSEEALFGWIVSDFGLNDAIESGLVKTPRVVVRDNGKLTPEYKSRFYHLYRDPDVKDDLNRKAEPQDPLPDLVTQAYTLLGTDWQECAEKWRKQKHPVPPVMITVANRIETAARIKFSFDRGKIQIPELCVPEKTLQIDSEELNKAESEELTSTDNVEHAADDEGTEPKLTRKQRAEHIRKMVSTVGQIGQPGEQLQNVISVAMLSEGWDAKTVTHIMGLRAFTSQLLCEQVVGRGLRRTTYDLNPETQRFEPEYVNIFGVPFTFLPHEEGESVAPVTPKPKTLIQPLRERESDFGMTWPNVVRVEHVYEPTLAIDVDKVPELLLDPKETPTHAELAAILEGKPNMDALSEINLQDLAKRNRMQTIIFKIASNVFDQMQPKWEGTKESLLGQVIRIVEQVLRSDRIRCKAPGFDDDELKRRVLRILNMNRIVEHVFRAIKSENSTRLVPVFDSQKPIMSTGDMRPWYTSRPCEHARRSHINQCVYDSTWEASESFELDRSGNVEAWVKNEHLGFEILYSYRGVIRKYRPDYIVRLTNGTMLILEVKGERSDQSDAKHDFLAEWVEAVNSHGGFGQWAWAVSYDPADVGGMLAKFGNDSPAARHSAQPRR